MLDRVGAASLPPSRASFASAASARPLSIAGASLPPSSPTSARTSGLPPSSGASTAPTSAPVSDLPTSAPVSDLPASVPASTVATSALVSGVPLSIMLVSNPRPPSKRLSGFATSRRPSALPSTTEPSPVARRSPLRPPQAPSAPINARQSTSFVLVIALAAPASVRAVPNSLHPDPCANAPHLNPHVRVSAATDLSTSVGTSRLCSRTDGPGYTIPLPGFMMPLGSRACLIRRIRSISTALL